MAATIRMATRGESGAKRGVPGRARRVDERRRAAGATQASLGARACDRSASPVGRSAEDRSGLVHRAGRLPDVSGPPDALAPTTPPAEPRQRWRLVLARDARCPARLASATSPTPGWTAIEATGLPLHRTAGRAAAARSRSGRRSRLGMAAEGELLDLVLTERWPVWRVREALAIDCPPAGAWSTSYDVWLGGPPLAGRVAAADYRIELAGDAATPVVAAAAAVARRRDRCRADRVKGGGDRPYDLRPLLIDVRVDDGGRRVACGRGPGSTRSSAPADPRRSSPPSATSPARRSRSTSIVPRAPPARRRPGSRRRPVRHGARRLTEPPVRPYTPPSAPRPLPGAIPCPTARSSTRVARRRHERVLRIHVRSHRDRREAIPRRGRHRARGRAPRCRARQDRSPSSASSWSPTATTRTSAAARRRRRGQRRGPPPGPRREDHLLQVPPQGPQPRQEGPSPGADDPAHQRHRRWAARARPRTAAKAEADAKTERQRLEEAAAAQAAKDAELAAKLARGQAKKAAPRRRRREGRGRRRRSADDAKADAEEAATKAKAEGRREGRAKATDGEGHGQGRPTKPAAKAAATPPPRPRAKKPRTTKKDE